MNEGDNTSTTTTTTTTCKNVNKERYLVRPETKETYIHIPVNLLAHEGNTKHYIDMCYLYY